MVFKQIIGVLSIEVAPVNALSQPLHHFRQQLSPTLSSFTLGPSSSKRHWLQTIGPQILSTGRKEM
jgi:hypothetical protein